jgi:hypothetical protein
MSLRRLEEAYSMDASSAERNRGRLPWWAVFFVLTVVTVLAGLTFAYSRLLVAGSSTTGGVKTTNTTGSSASGGAASSTSGPGTSQTVEGNGVSLTLAWQGGETGPAFSVTMDTHSGSLDGYDLAQLTVLRTASGQEVTPASWDAPSGGHHRKGTLTFPGSGPDGTPLIGAGNGPVTVIIRDVAGVGERVFTWTP